MGQVGDPGAIHSATGLEPPALLLATAYRSGVDVTEYWVSEKLDGVRAYWDGARLVTRGGHRVRAPAWFTAGFPPQPLDGELWMGRGTFERLSGIVRRLNGDPADWCRVRYLVFDLPGLSAPFDERLAALRALMTDPGSRYLDLVEQFRVTDEAELRARLVAVTQAGGEGLMLHQGAARAVIGRSGGLMKLKPYQDDEARVVGHVPGKGRHQGRLGALIVEDAAGRRFRLGTGFSDAERQDPPPIGTLVTYRYQGRSGTGLPRFAVYLRVRGDE